MPNNGVVWDHEAVKWDAPSSAIQMPQQPVAPLPNIDMQTVTTPKSVGTSFGQGLLDVPRGLTHALDTWMEPEKNIGEPQSQYWQSTKQQFKQGDPAWVANLANAILAPTGIPQQTQAFAQGARQDPVRAMGQGAGMYIAGKIPEVPEMARTGAQKTLGIGPNFVREGAEKVGEEQANVVGENQQKLQQARIAEPQRFDEAAAKRQTAITQAQQDENKAFADADAKHQKQVQTIQQANAESQVGFDERQRHVDIADQHAQMIADQLPQLHQAARAEASEAYGPQPKGTYDPEEIRNLIEDTAKAKLQGSTQMPTAVAKIIKDIDQPPAPSLLDQASVFRGAGKQMRAGGTVSASEALSMMDPRARAKYLESLSPEERTQVEAPQQQSGGTQQPIDAARLHGFMNELGRAARSRTLGGDEVSAINATRTAIEERLRKLYDNEDRLGDFKAGQAKWKQMANTFENTNPPAKGGSPIAQALQARDPVTGKLRPDYVQAALTGDNSYPVAQQLFDRYRHLGAPTNALEVMKTHGDFAETLPSKVKWRDVPAGPNYPTVTKYPQVESPNFTEFGKLGVMPEDFDPVEARKVALKQKAASLSGTGGPYGVMRDVMGMTGLLRGNPMALAYPALRRAIGWQFSKEALANWLSKATPEELQMAQDIPARKVALKKAQLRP